MSYDVTNFDGYVTVKHTVIMPNGRSYWGFLGKVSVLEGKAMVGFEIKDESNWVCRVESPDGKRSVNFPGCQVQAIGQGTFEDVATNSVYVL